ncbi:hypothetical protein ASG42_11615 [Rhizobium sp. Leaf391]|uniref:ABC-three component system middle component 5 n=1 Tax=Rhizobium sp. Leaf391 TaxID=1736360 RepID=UPI000714A620|nr:ABC-three component system middle component 5 [Rhizobium sp. Leaf391]KQS91125.1 hypothetical protein ASG42_11615 [Rhizobium sp. Leaf391]
MIHLSYHPAFDAFHAIFRLLRLKFRRDVSEVEVDKLRILDYYLLFPWRASSIRLAQPDLEVRRIAKKLEAQQDYATLPTGETLLERMRASQTAALQTMAQDGVIDFELLRNGIVKFKAFSLPDDVKKRIDARNEEDSETMKIIDVLGKYPLLGPDGLKGRTTLLEHRYDKI